MVQIGCDVLLHQLYLPGLTALKLLGSLQNMFNGKNINYLQSSENHFITQKDTKFWGEKIVMLPQRWQKLMEQNDIYEVK